MEGLITLGKDVLNRFEKSGVVYKLMCKKCKKCKVTYVRQTGRLLNTRVEEHKKNLGRKCDYHNVLSDHRNDCADHDFDWNNVEILHSESNKGKREFIEILYTRDSLQRAFPHASESPFPYDEQLIDPSSPTTMG